MRFLPFILCFTTALVFISGAVGQSVIEQKVLNAFFHDVIDSLTHSGGGNGAVIDTTKSYIQVGTIGIPLDPTQFNNIVSPGNVNGSYSQAEYFNELINNIGPVRNVDNAYGAIITAAHAEVDIDPTKYAAYQRCWNVLKVNQSFTDPVTGETSSSISDSPLFLRYEEKRTAYLAAVSAYYQALLTYDLTNVHDQRLWLATAPVLQGNIDAAQDEFNSVSPVVKSALAGLNSLGASLSETVINQAKNLYQTASLPSTILGGTGWHLSPPFPWNFATSQTIYNKFIVSSSQTNVATSSSYSSWSASAGVNLGFFSIGGNAGGSSSGSSYSSSATQITIKGEVSLVEIHRPWLLDTVFAIGGWSIPGSPSKIVSTGFVGSQPAIELLPSYPTHLIVTRNVTLSGTWTTADSSYFSSEFHSGASVSFGPFALGGGSYKHSRSSSTFAGHFENSVFSIDGLQVIGWVNGVVPASPVVDG